MPISAALKEFKSVIRSLNWYLKRNKQYEAAQFDIWKKNNGTAEAAIKTALTNFKIDNLVEAVEEYFKYIDINSVELDVDDKYFLANFENLENFMINDTLCNLKKKHMVQEDIATCFQKMNLNLNVTIESLDGTEDEIEDWFDNFDRIGNSNGWSNEIKAFKIPCYLKETALLIWQNCSPTDKKDYNAIKQQILSKLAPTDSRELIFYSRVQKESETVIEFCLRLEKLARKAFGTINKDKEILRIFWDGLKIDIRKLTVSASPKNLQEALEIAQKAEKLLAGSREIKEISKISEVQVSSIKHRNSRKESRSPTHAERARHSSKSFSPYRNYKQERATTPYRRQDSPTRKCYNCGRIGHVARDCRTKKEENYNRISQQRSRRDKSRNTDVICYNCGKSGHISSYCNSKNY